MPERAAPTDSADIVVVGAGAAGLATAIFARRADASRSVVLLEGARRPGAKILVSGGSRCNVTNTVVTERDFWGGPSRIVRQVLRALPVDETVAFFLEIGVPLHEEADGKLFPDSNRARDVLDALLQEADRVGVSLVPESRVVDLTRTDNGFRVTIVDRIMRARAVVLAAGGQSLPKTGSDGFGFELARRLGHTVVPTTPGLVPLVLDAGKGPNRGNPANPANLSGISHDVELTIWIDGRVAIRLAGSMLWTHFGISGPVAMNASRHWHRARLEGRDVAITMNCCGGSTFDAVDTRWTALALEKPRTALQNALATIVPFAVGAALIDTLKLDGGCELAHLPREARRHLTHALVAWPLPVTGSRGYNFAEVTAGGVALTEIDPATMASRVCPGLHLVGEILDVDGRIGGFNFQWAWASGRVAGTALGHH